MLRPIRKVKKRKNRFSVNSHNVLYTIFCEPTVVEKYFFLIFDRNSERNYYRVLNGQDIGNSLSIYLFPALVKFEVIWSTSVDRSSVQKHFSSFLVFTPEILYPARRIFRQSLLYSTQGDILPTIYFLGRIVK